MVGREEALPLWVRVTEGAVEEEEEEEEEEREAPPPAGGGILLLIGVWAGVWVGGSMRRMMRVVGGVVGVVGRRTTSAAAFAVIWARVRLLHLAT